MMEGVLVGMAFSAMKSVQDALIQGEHGRALTIVNEAIRDLNERLTQKPCYSGVHENDA